MIGKYMQQYINNKELIELHRGRKIVWNSCKDKI